MINLSRLYKQTRVYLIPQYTRDRSFRLFLGASYTLVLYPEINIQRTKPTKNNVDSILSCNRGFFFTNYVCDYKRLRARAVCVCDTRCLKSTVKKPSQGLSTVIFLSRIGTKLHNIVCTYICTHTRTHTHTFGDRYHKPAPRRPGTRIAIVKRFVIPSHNIPLARIMRIRKRYIVVLLYNHNCIL